MILKSWDARANFEKMIFFRNYFRLSAKREEFEAFDGEKAYGRDDPAFAGLFRNAVLDSPLYGGGR